MIRWAARHPIVPAALAGVCLCLGLTALHRLPVAYLLDAPQAPLWVSFSLPSQPGREVVLERIVRPFAARCAAEPGIAHHSCHIGDSWAGCQVEPLAGSDRKRLAARLRELSAAVAGSGPANTVSRVWRARAEAERPGLVVQLTGVRRQQVAEELLPELHRIEGLRTVELFPRDEPVLQLAVTDPDPGAAAAVRSTLRRAVRQQVLGHVATGPVQAAAPPATLPALLDLPIALGPGGRVTPLGELVQPSMYRDEPAVHYRVNGREGLFLIVRDDPLRPRRSALAAARMRIEGWTAAHNGGSTVVVDLWQEALQALQRLATAAAAGMILAIIALGLALRRLRAVLLLAVTVPLSLLLTLVLLAITGQGLDVVACGSLAVAVGLLVDAAVVVAESLASRRERDPRQRAAAGVQDAVRPLALGGLTTIAALAPVWFGTGQEMVIMQAATVPLAAGILASLLVAATIVPGLATAMGRLPRIRRPALLGRLVKRAVRDPLVAIALVLAPALVLLLLLRLTGGVYLGEGDPRQVEIVLADPAGAGTRTFDATLATLEQELAGLDGVGQVLSAVNEQQAWLWLYLERSSAVGKRRRQVIGRAVRTLGEGMYRSPFRWRLSDDSRNVLQHAQAETREQALARLGVLISADDPQAIAHAAAQIAAVTRQAQPPPPGRRRVLLEPALPGAELQAALLPAPEERLPIELDMAGSHLGLAVRGAAEPPAGIRLPLQRWLASPGPGGAVPAELARARVVEVPAWPSFRDGRFERRIELAVADRQMTLEQLEESRAAMHRLLRQLPLPAGVSLTVDELSPERPLPPWLGPLSLALLGLLLLLGIGFESLLAPLRVLAVVLPHLAGAVLALWLLQVRVNEAAVLGGLLLLGVAVNAGVLIDDRFLRLRRSGVRQTAAVVRAGIERGPAVLLTAATSVLALAPLWLSGVDQLGRPLVAVLGGGLLLGTPATLLLLPALQSLGAPRPVRRTILWRGDGSDEIVLRSLSRSYGPLRALDGVSARLEPGMVGLLGPNGAGKTTLLRCLVGAIHSDTGDVWINGVPRHEDRAGWRALLGYLPQAQTVPEGIEGGLWLELWAGELGLADARTAAAQALATMGVAELAQRRLGELSGGQRRRVSVARALLGNPSVLVVDEPTTGLDPEARVELRTLLAGLARERLVLLSTHIPEDIAVACNRVLVLAAGRLRFDGTVGELRRRADGHVRQRLLADSELQAVAREHRIVSRRREPDGIRVRYLCEATKAPGELVEPTLEEAYLWLLGSAPTYPDP